MITCTEAYKVGEQFFTTLKEAQHAAVLSLFAAIRCEAEPGLITHKMAATAVLENKDQVIAILTGTKPRKPRADRGKSHRKPQAPSEVKDSPEPGVLPGVKVEASTKYRGK